MKSPYEESLTDARIADLHAGKRIRVCNRAYYDKIEKPAVKRSRQAIINDDDAAKISEYLTDNPNRSGSQISDATGLRVTRVTRLVRLYPDTFSLHKIHRNVLYNVK